MDKNAIILKGGEIIKVRTDGVKPPCFRELVIKNGGRLYSVKAERISDITPICIMKYEVIE